MAMQPPGRPALDPLTGARRMELLGGTMRRQIAALVATTILCANSGLVVAQDPLPSPVMTVQRVEAPEAGIALTVPGDWNVSQPMVEVLPGLVQVLVATKPGSGGCWVGLAAPWVPTSLQDFTDGVMLPFRLHPDYEVADGMADASLPAGPALRGYMVQHFPEGDLHQVPYILAAPDGFVFMNCLGYNRPSDDWLSIAETFEFLPETSAGPAATDG